MKPDEEQKVNEALKKEIESRYMKKIAELQSRAAALEEKIIANRFWLGKKLYKKLYHHALVLQKYIQLVGEFNLKSMTDKAKELREFQENIDTLSDYF